MVDLRASLEDYCDTDVQSETDIDSLAPALSDAERRVWELDQTINDRGVMIDTHTVTRAINVVEHAKERLDKHMAEITGGAVRKCSEAARLVAWIREQGIECESVAKGEYDDVVADAKAAGLPHVVRALALRKEAAKSSTAKLRAMLACVCSDNRARGLLHYHGTNTGRWAGRLFQPQNMYRTDPEKDGPGISRTIALISALSPSDADEAITLIDGSTMTMAAKMLRSMIIAKFGHRFIGADLSNIEGRYAAWCTSEEWKLAAFRLFDAGLGPDLYKVAYGKAFGVDPKEVDKAGRQIGKVMELALGYQGGVGSFLNMAAVYGMKIPALVDPVRRAADPALWAKFVEQYSKKGTRRYDLPQDEWVAIKVIVHGWRAAHPLLVQSWWDLQDAAIEAVANPGMITEAMGGKARYVCSRGFLWLSLPSGRVIAYYAPKLRMNKTMIMRDGEEIDANDWTSLDVQAARDDGGYLRIKKSVSYTGYDGVTKRWGEFHLYGGMQFNHFVQGGARDVLVSGAFRAEAAGYPIVLTVHDENLAEVPIGFGSADELARLMATNDTWNVGLPLAAAGWEDERYAK